MFSLGICIYNVISGDFPFANEEAIRKGAFAAVSDELAQNLLERMLVLSCLSFASHLICFFVGGGSDQKSDDGRGVVFSFLAHHRPDAAKAWVIAGASGGSKVEVSLQC